MEPESSPRTPEDKFVCDISYTAPVNHPDYGPLCLSLSDVWRGIRRGGRHPDDFGSFIAKVEILDGGGETEFSRVLTMREGAVHLKEEQSIVQDVVIRERLYVQSTTRDTGARTIMLVANHAASQDDQEDPHIVLIYELRMGEDSPEPGSPEALRITKEYNQLARNMVLGSIRDIRRWKEEGQL